MTEEELRAICKRHGLSLRTHTRMGRKSPNYEAYTRIARKKRTVYLFAASRLPHVTESDVIDKLAPLIKKDTETA